MEIIDYLHQWQNQRIIQPITKAIRIIEMVLRSLKSRSMPHQKELKIHIVLNINNSLDERQIFKKQKKSKQIRPKH